MPSRAAASRMRDRVLLELEASRAGRRCITVAWHRSARVAASVRGGALAPPGIGGGEQLELDLALVEAVLLQALGDLQHHVLRPADEGRVDGPTSSQCSKSCRHFSLSMRPLNRSMSCCSRLRTWVRLDAAQMLVLQLLQLLAEHDRAGGAVAVEQREAAVRLGRQRRLDDAEQRA